MQRSAGNLQDRLQKSWTYLDVLALALAEADGRQFDTDRAKWNHLVADLQERFPRLLADIYFDRRDPETLYSEEVSDFLRFMIRSGVFENPTFRVYEMSEPTKEAVKEKQWPRLERFRSDILEMATVIRDRLKPMNGNGMNGHRAP